MSTAASETKPVESPALKNYTRPVDPKTDVAYVKSTYQEEVKPTGDYPPEFVTFMQEHANECPGADAGDAAFWTWVLGVWEHAVDSVPPVKSSASKEPEKHEDPKKHK